jgi:hypothetical protein
MASHFSIYFNHWHAQIVNGRRPDITVFNQTFDAKLYDGVPYVERLKRLYPRWNSIFDAYLTERRFPVKELIAISSREPIFLEADPELRSHSLLNAMHGRGITFQLGGSPTVAPAHSSWVSLYKNLSPMEIEDFGTWSLLLLHHFSGAIVHLKNGEVAHTLDEASRGEAIKGGALWDGFRRYGAHLQQMRSNPVLFKDGIEHLRSTDFWVLLGAQ